MKVIISALTIFCLSSCMTYKPPQPTHSFNIKIDEEKVEMPKADFDLLFEAYVLYYEIEID